jgi:hypothetical protein
MDARCVGDPKKRINKRIIHPSENNGSQIFFESDSIHTLYSQPF